MSTQYWQVDKEVLDMAQDLIYEHHEDLYTARIGFLFRGTAPKSKGRYTYGKAGKVSSKWAALIGDEEETLDFVIWLAHDKWEELELKQKKALLDHELQHCYMEDGQAKMRGHDLEEFAVIVQRHGLWNHEIKKMAHAIAVAKQLEIPFGELADKVTVKAVGPERNFADEVAAEMEAAGLEIVEEGD